MDEGQSQHRVLLTVSVTLATVLQAVDTTIANVALPHIGGNLSASRDQMDWVLTSYILAAAIMTPLSGWLAGQYGRKRVLVLSVIGFTVSSMLCGMAQSIEQIVLFRVLQGVSGAALGPQSQAVLLDINPPERHGRAMALWGQGVVLGPMLAPMLGGWLTDNYSWRWVFFINVPFGILAALGFMAYMRETSTRRARFDFLGFGSLSLAVGALQIFLDRGSLQDWFGSIEIWIEVGISVAALYVFAVHMLTARDHPFVSLALFKDRNFAAGNILVFVASMTMFSTLALLPQLLEDLLGYPVITSGIAMVPRGIGSFISMYVTGRLIGRVDPRVLIAGGIALVAAALGVSCGFSTSMPQSLVWITMFLQGLGNGFTYITITTVAFSGLGAQYRSEGASIFNLLRNIGSSIGIAGTGALLIRNTQVMHERLAAHIVPYGGQLQLHAPFSFTAPAGLAALNAAVTQQAQMIAYNDDFKLMFVMTLALLPLVLLLRPGRARTEEPVVLE